jgi:hypothetical protein
MTFQARLDLFADDVYTTPGAVGFAVIYPGESPFVKWCCFAERL